MNCRTCGAENARPYGTGWQCPAHTPAVIAGRPEPHTDPELTLEALYAKRGIKHGYEQHAGSLIDERAVASGRRRFKSVAEYRAAQRAEDARKQAEKARRKA